MINGVKDLLVLHTETGLEIRGCREPRAPLNSPAAPSNFCWEPKNVLVSIHKISRKL